MSKTHHFLGCVFSPLKYFFGGSVELHYQGSWTHLLMFIAQSLRAIMIQKKPKVIGSCWDLSAKSRGPGSWPAGVMPATHLIKQHFSFILLYMALILVIPMRILFKEDLPQMELPKTFNDWLEQRERSKLCENCKDVK
jgi:hypothetical protein